MTLPKTMRARGESLLRTCRFSTGVRPRLGPCGIECESLIKKLRARVGFIACSCVSPRLGSSDCCSVVRPCLGSVGSFCKKIEKYHFFSKNESGKK